MTPGTVLSFLVTLVVVSALLFVLVFMYNILSNGIGLWRTSRWIGEVEQKQKVEIIASIVVIFLLFLLAKGFFRSDRPSSGLAVTVVLVVFVSFEAWRCWQIFHTTGFSADKWHARVEKPFPMTRSMVQRGTFVGKDTQEIERLYGKPCRVATTPDSFIRLKEAGNWFFWLIRASCLVPI